MTAGRCTCGAVSYRMTAAPMIVHCCHCSWCQRESGSAFVMNAVVETAALDVSGTPELVETPSASGAGQTIARCPECRVALWSHYPNAGRKAAFVRVGTLAEPNAFPPDVHVYTSTRQGWVALPEGAPAFEGFYNPAELWTPAMRARWAAMMAS
ncbi:GFA family protein [Sphingomonas sp. KR3-1]|uniref:GFA family protein n=1 Tax=Sphingomonas sp. KR3-1 TaxID=3156611 RepID=UPI0032B3D873